MNQAPTILKPYGLMNQVPKLFAGLINQTTTILFWIG